MDNLSSDQELPEISYELSRRNQDGIIISFGPKNGFLWRGEVANSNDLIGSLKKVFEKGFTPGDEHSSLAQLPYIQSHLGFICASNTYRCGVEFTGFESEKASAGMYGYIYLIDTSEKNIQSIPLCEENLLNENFVAGYAGIGEIYEGPDYAIIPKASESSAPREYTLVEPKYIIGAVPTEDVAGSLRIEEKSFVQNHVYQGSVSSGKLKEFLGDPKLYRLELDKLVSAQSCSSSAFFHEQPRSPESPSSNEYGYQCER